MNHFIKLTNYTEHYTPAVYTPIKQAVHTYIHINQIVAFEERYDEKAERNIVVVWTTNQNVSIRCTENIEYLIEEINKRSK